jgi:hypothetical protein
MALINLTTNLKSLKFGNDQFDGGSSNQPYIQTPIPENTGEYGFLDLDFILRGGSKAVTDSLIDVKRLGKYFTDTKNPSGILFVAKQNLLSRIAVKTQASGLLNEGAYTPLSTLTQAGGNAFGLHVNKQGLNPFNGIGSLRTYTDVINPELGEAFSIKSIDKNRLVELYKNNQDFNSDTFVSNQVNILTYGGGPDSIIGIGNTNIRFADQRTGYGSGKNPNTYLTTNIETDRTDLPDGPKPKITNNNKGKVQDSYVDLSIEPITPDPNSEGIYTYTQQDLNNIPASSIDNGESFYIGGIGITTPGDFRQLLRKTVSTGSITNIGNLTNAPNYTKKNIEQRVNLGDPGNRNGKDLTSYVNGAGGGKASSGSYDKINAFPIYESEGIGGIATFDGEKNDLVKFAITVLDTKKNITTNIHFRAFLNQISDAYTAEWNATRYIGRGENFYTYGGFDRKFSLSWTVAAQSKIELIPMYKKLNYLASVCAPNYSANGYMAGNIVRLTVGGYLYNQPGIITGFNYEMNDDNATWEIGIPDNSDITPFYDSSVKELPHLIKVTGFNFIPIHEFVPRLVQEPNSGTTERFIALANGTGLSDTNYI